jgi:hypothetical protein
MRIFAQLLVVNLLLLLTVGVVAQQPAAKPAAKPAAQPAAPQSPASQVSRRPPFRKSWRR